jgi:ligand-binding sensor domain-containing protein
MEKAVSRFTSIAIVAAMFLSLGAACRQTEEPMAITAPSMATVGPPTPPIPTPIPPIFEAMRSLEPGWTSYTSANNVYDIALDYDGNLWATTSGGVVRWDPTDGTYIKYTAADGLAQNIVYSIAVASDGALWFGTRRGASRFDGRSWTTYTAEDGLAEDSVLSIAATPDGALWLGHGEVVSHFDGRAWTTHPIKTEHCTRWVEAGPEAGLCETAIVGVYSIAVASDGALWFGTQYGGVSRFDGARWTTYTTKDGLASNRVLSIAVAPDGALWFGTEGGVSRYLPPD